MLDRERREIENLRCLLGSKDREIVELCSDLLVKEKLIMQLQIDKEKLKSQLEDCIREPWKQPLKHFMDWLKNVNWLICMNWLISPQIRM